jgi:hypothetical protein
MSDRPLIKPNILAPIINAVSTAASITGAPTIIQRLPGISYDVSWTGTTTGTFSIEVSNTYTQNPDGTTANAGNWTALPAASFVGTMPAPAGSAGTGFIDILGTEAYAIRIVYTRVSGTGTLTVVPCAKVW